MTQSKHLAEAVRIFKTIDVQNLALFVNDGLYFYYSTTNDNSLKKKVLIFSTSLNSKLLVGNGNLKENLTFVFDLDLFEIKAILSKLFASILDQVGMFKTSDVTLGHCEVFAKLMKIAEAVNAYYEEQDAIHQQTEAA
jgi:hypothetical protein